MDHTGEMNNTRHLQHRDFLACQGNIGENEICLIGRNSIFHDNGEQSAFIRDRETHETANLQVWDYFEFLDGRATLMLVEELIVSVLQCKVSKPNCLQA